jgi:hypothetical protein
MNRRLLAVATIGISMSLLSGFGWDKHFDLS